jgi:hypothetical protein
MRTTPGCALPPLRTRHPGARAAAANGGHAVVPHRRRTRPAGRASRGGQPILVKGAVVPQPRIWADRLQARLGTTRYLVTVGTAASADIAVVPIGSPRQFRSCAALFHDRSGRRARGDRDIAAALRRTVRAPPESGHSCPSPEHEPDMLAPCRCPGRDRLDGCVPEAACHGGRSGGRSCAARASSTRGASVEACPGWGYPILSAPSASVLSGPGLSGARTSP